MGTQVSNLPLKLGLVDTKNQLTSPVPDRASDVYVVNPDNVMVKYRGNGEQLVEDSNDLTAGSWIETGSGTVNSATLFTFAAQNDVLNTGVTTVEGRSYIYSFKVRAISGNTSLTYVYSGSATGSDSPLTVTSTLTRYSITVLGRAGGGTVSFGIQDRNAAGHGQIEFTEIQVEETSVPINELEDETGYDTANYRISLHADASYFTGDDGAGADIQNFAGTGHLLKVTIGGVSVYGYIGAAEGGEALEAEEATGTATLNKLYKITASEVNHFYTGSIIGDYFVSDGAESLDANNKVQEVSSSDATGVTIYTTQALAAEGWALIEDGFIVQPANGAAITFEIYDNVLGDTEPRVYTATSGATATIPAEAPFDSKGLVNVGPVTNWLLQSKDWTQAIWTKSNMTSAYTSTGMDGTANSATRLTASSANGTATQVLTVDGTTNSWFFWARRITGTGDVQLTDDNFTSNTVLSLTSSWQKFEINDAGTAPTVGIKIVTNTDAIDVDFGMLIERPYSVNWAIPTLSVPVTTTSQVVPWTMSTVFKGILSDAVNGSESEGTLIASWTPRYDEADGSLNVGIVTVYGNEVGFLYTNHGSVIRSYDHTNAASSDTLNWIANTTYILVVRWSKRRDSLQVSVIDAGVLTNGTATSYDGAFGLGTDLIIGYGNNYPFSLAKLMVFNGWLADSEVSDYPNNIGLSVRRHIKQGR